MPQTRIHKLGSPRKIAGECNTWDVIWALQINGIVHQISMKRRFSQKLAVKHDGKTLLDKVFIFSKPYEGYCFMAWVSQGVNFGIYYNTPLMSIRTNADHYDLRVNGVKFMDLPDGCRLRQAQKEMALRRYVAHGGVPASTSRCREASVPTVPKPSAAPASGSTKKDPNNGAARGRQRWSGNQAVLAKAQSSGYPTK